MNRWSSKSLTFSKASAGNWLTMRACYDRAQPLLAPVADPGIAPRSMNTKHHESLTDALKVPASDVQWLFISDYYDGPISGLAQFRGSVFRFCCFPEDIPEQHVFVLEGKANYGIDS